MTWLLIGFAFGLGAVAAMVVACITLITVGAIKNVIEERRKLKAVVDSITKWEGTD